MNFENVAKILARPYGMEMLTLAERVHAYYHTPVRNEIATAKLKRELSSALFHFQVGVLKQVPFQEQTAKAVDLNLLQNLIYETLNIESSESIVYNLPDSRKAGTGTTILDVSMKTGCLIHELIKYIDHPENGHIVYVK